MQLFQSNSTKGINYLIEKSYLKNDAKSIARFLFDHCDELDKTSSGKK